MSILIDGHMGYIRMYKCINASLPFTRVNQHQMCLGIKFNTYLNFALALPHAIASQKQTGLFCHSDLRNIHLFADLSLSLSLTHTLTRSLTPRERGGDKTYINKHTLSLSLFLSYTQTHSHSLRERERERESERER